VPAGTPPQSSSAKSLLRSLHSSPAALERTLQDFALPPEEQEETNLLLEALGEIEDDAPTEIEPIDAAKARTIAVRALDEMEAIQVDSKLNAFTALLRELTQAETRPIQVCVITEFVSTLYYLAAGMEGRELGNPLLHDGIPDTARDESLRTFESNGGVLIATTSVMIEGLSLPYVTDLVLYDLPTSRFALDEVLGRFDRFGRSTQLRIHALAPSDGAANALSGQLQILREIVSGEQVREDG
jgi:superfamily II DNA or RNA helicase